MGKLSALGHLGHVVSPEALYREVTSPTSDDHGALTSCLSDFGGKMIHVHSQEGQKCFLDFKTPHLKAQ